MSTYRRKSSVRAILSSAVTGAVAITTPLSISSSKPSGSESRIWVQSSLTTFFAISLITGILTPLIPSFPGVSLELNSASSGSDAASSIAR